MKRKNENAFQKELIKEIRSRWKGIDILKNDANYMQGVPDLSLFYNNKWAMLEVKRSQDETHQPNQDYYVEHFDKMSFARFIFPENKEDVLDAMGEFFKA